MLDLEIISENEDFEKALKKLLEDLHKQVKDEKQDIVLSFSDDIGHQIVFSPKNKMKPRHRLTCRISSEEI